MIVDFKTFEMADYQNRKGGKFWGNIGAGVLVFAKDSGKFLIAMRSRFVNEPNTYGIIGGKVDDEETVELSSEALRELKEETGYKGKIEMSLLSIYRVPTFSYHTFLGIIDEEFEPVAEPHHGWENSFFKWVSYEELLTIEPKHFGLEYTIKNSGDKLKKISELLMQ